jgi:hypothetical protein
VVEQLVEARRLAGGRREAAPLVVVRGAGGPVEDRIVVGDGEQDAAPAHQDLAGADRRAHEEPAAVDAGRASVEAGIEPLG